jgi:hypothetical protein
MLDLVEGEFSEYRASRFGVDLRYFSYWKTKYVDLTLVRNEKSVSRRERGSVQWIPLKHARDICTNLYPPENQSSEL